MQENKSILTKKKTTKGPIFCGKEEIEIMTRKIGHAKKSFEEWGLSRAADRFSRV